MRKPAAGNAGAGFSQNDLVEQESQVIADPARPKQVRRRKVKSYKPPPRCPNTIDLEDWLAEQDEP